MAKSRFEYVKEYETNCTIMTNCYIVIRISKSLDTPVEKPALHWDEESLMNYCATKVNKSFQEIMFSYGNFNEHSFVFHRTTNIYNRRASKISSCINSLFTAFYVTQWPNFSTTTLECPVFFASTFIIPSFDTLRSYLVWRQSSMQNENRKETELEIVGTLYARQRITLGNKASTHILPYRFDFSSASFYDFWHKQFETTAKKIPPITLDDEIVSKLNEEHKQIVQGKCKATDLDYYKLWGSYRVIISKANKSHGSYSTLADNLPHSKEFEVEDLVPADQWIVLRVDGKGFHEFSKKHNFEKPNDEDALNVMNFAAIKVMLSMQDIVLAYGQSDEYSFVLHKSTAIFGRKASKIESYVNSRFTANYIQHWSTWNPQRKLLTLPTFDVRTVPYPSDEILRDYLSWRQADVHINNLYNTLFWKLVLDQGMKNSDAEEYLRINGKYSTDKRKLLESFDINYDTLPAMYRKGTILLRKTVKYENRNCPMVVPYCVDMIGDAFWQQEHPEILTREQSSTVEFTSEAMSSLCMQQLSEDCLMDDMARVSLEDYSVDGSSRAGIQGLLCKCELFPNVHSLVPRCWIVVKINGRNFKDFSLKHQFEMPNDDKGLDLMSFSAHKIISEHRDIVLAYGYSDVYVFVFHRSSKLYKQLQDELAKNINDSFTQQYEKYWSTWFANKILQNPPSFNTTVSSYATLDQIIAYLGNEQRVAHEKNLYNTVLWNLIQIGGRSLVDAERELQKTTEADRNECLFQEFGINYNNMPTRHKKGSILLPKQIQIDDKLIQIAVPLLTDLNNNFRREHSKIFQSIDRQIVPIDAVTEHALVQVQIDDGKLQNDTRN